DGLGLIARADEIDALAASVPDTGGVHFVPALSGLGAPYWDPHARGTITGITRGTSRAHLARATLEAIAFQSAVLIEAMAADSCTSASASCRPSLATVARTSGRQRRASSFRVETSTMR